MLSAQRIQAEDFLRYNPHVRNTLAQLKLFRSTRSIPVGTGDAVDRLHELCAVARMASDNTLVLEAEEHIHTVLAKIDPGVIPWGKLLPDPESRRITKGIILKPYVSPREKGVVYVSFENQMARMALASDLATFASRYTLVTAPSWCPPHSVYTYLFPLVYPDTIHSGISNTRDLVLFPRISRKYRMVPLYASNWVDPRELKPVPQAEKNIDIFMLANFAKYKRHHAFFRALRDVPPHFRVVLNGQSEPGRSRETILNEAGAFGVRDRFVLRENVSDQELHDNLVHAKTTVILSMREGSCVAVVEAMMANTPVGMLHDAEIGSKVFITPQSGKLLQHDDLGQQLTAFVTASDTYQPREWALNSGIDCVQSSNRLNTALREWAMERGDDWTRDIATLRWRPNPAYYNADDAPLMRDAYDDIATLGLQVGVSRP